MAATYLPGDLTPTVAAHPFSSGRPTRTTLPVCSALGDFRVQRILVLKTAFYPSFWLGLPRGLSGCTTRCQISRTTSKKNEDDPLNIEPPPFSGLALLSRVHYLIDFAKGTGLSSVILQQKVCTRIFSSKSLFRRTAASRLQASKKGPPKCSRGTSVICQLGEWRLNLLFRCLSCFRHFVRLVTDLDGWIPVLKVDL